MFATVTDGLLLQGNTFAVKVNVGDPGMEPLQWTLGSVGVKQRNGVDLVVPQLSKREQQYQPQPEITHMHRPEHKQPVAVVPLATSALVIACLAVWLMALSKFHLNLKGVPQGRGRAAAGAFQVLLAGALMFAVWFWAKMTLIDALLPMAGIAVATVVVGHRALSALADKRIARQAKLTKSS